MKRSSVLIPAILVLMATCGFGAYHKFSGLPNGPTGAIQFNDGTDFAGSGNMAWDGSQSRLTLSATSSTGASLACMDGSNPILWAGLRLGSPQFACGDTNLVAGNTSFSLDDPTQTMMLNSAGTISLGEMQGFGNGTLFQIDDPNQRTTSNVPHYADLDTIQTRSGYGPTLKDTANGHWYTISITNGVIGLVDRGTVLP